jgi:excisionase family DNA binding protein
MEKLKMAYRCLKCCQIALRDRGLDSLGILNYAGPAPDDLYCDWCFAAAPVDERQLAAIVAHTEALKAQPNLPSEGLPEVMTTDEVAAWLKMNRKTICDAANRGDLPAQKVGKNFRFLRVRVMEWLHGVGPRSALKGGSK